MTCEFLIGQFEVVLTKTLQKEKVFTNSGNAVPTLFPKATSTPFTDATKKPKPLPKEKRPTKKDFLPI